MSIYKSPLPDISIPECSLAQLVLDQVKQYGNAVAFVDGMSGKETTYAELEMKIRKVAAGLHARGFKQGDVFAIYLPNCADYIVLFYAVAILGGTLSTVNPLYTAEELAFQLKDVSAKYLITLSMFLDKANEALEKVSTVKECFLLDKLAAEGSWLPYSGLFQAPSDTIPTVTVDAKKDTLVIPYSSGTTGLPKGVELTHYNLVSNILQVAQVEGRLIQGHQTLLAFLPFFHIYGMTLFLGFALYKGFKVVIMPKFDFDKFLELIQTQKVTFVHLAPPVALALAKHPLVDKYNLTSVQHIMSGAAPLSADLEEAVRKRLNVNIRQGYGMTESSPVSHIPFMDTKPGSIGLLLPNMEAKLIDTATAETIEGLKKEGELCMKGPNIMKGYLNRPDATAQTVDKDGFLHTGDVAYVDEDGYFFIVDRVKELIKYKGYQVPPAELEGLLLSHHAVADVAVIPIPDEEAGELPKAYVVAKPGQTLKEEDLHQFLEPKVAFYKKLRGGIEFTDVIPKSPSGKILRRILKQKEKERYESAKKPQN